VKVEFAEEQLIDDFVDILVGDGDGIHTQAILKVYFLLDDLLVALRKDVAGVFCKFAVELAYDLSLAEIGGIGIVEELWVDAGLVALISHHPEHFFVEQGRWVHSEILRWTAEHKHCELEQTPLETCEVQHQGVVLVS